MASEKKRRKLSSIDRRLKRPGSTKRKDGDRRHRGADLARLEQERSKPPGSGTSTWDGPTHRWSRNDPPGRIKPSPCIWPRPALVGADHVRGDPALDHLPDLIGHRGIDGTIAADAARLFERFKGRFGGSLGVTQADFIQAMGVGVGDQTHRRKVRHHVFQIDEAEDLAREVLLECSGGDIVSDHRRTEGGNLMDRGEVALEPPRGQAHAGPQAMPRDPDRPLLGLDGLVHGRQHRLPDHLQSLKEPLVEPRATPAAAKSVPARPSGRIK